MVDTSTSDTILLEDCTQVFPELWDKCVETGLNISDLYLSNSLEIINSSLDEIEPNIGNHPITEPLTTELSELTPVQNPTSSFYIPSSLPASQSWSGHHEFNISFDLQDKNTKGIAWTYSKIKDKLYVEKDSACPINFSVKDILTDNVVIRTTILFSSPVHTLEVVKRCLNHATQDKNKGILEAQHLVRCESRSAFYEIDPTTKHHSVVVPFENPPVGQQYSTYIYKFTCFGSCVGGPNRRDLMLLFSLEKEGRVIGRRKLDVKICACPGRDKKSEEKKLIKQTGIKSPAKRKETEAVVSLADTFEFTKPVMLPVEKKPKSDTTGPPYSIEMEDKKCYDFLKQMKQLFEMCKLVNNSPPSGSKLQLNQY